MDQLAVEAESLVNVDSGKFAYLSSPDAALEAIRAFEGPILVDFDETLYLRNSTEDFIDRAAPGVLALLLLRSLDVLKPWRMTGGVCTRDTWRVCAILTFFPWTAARWRAAIPALANRYLNRELKAALETRTRSPIIVTAGFHSIVAPLLAEMGFAHAPVIAAKSYSFADRRHGKLRKATSELGADMVARSLVVTDSTSDLELLQSCALPLRTLWPQARYRRALSRVYLPGEYLSLVKHPGQGYLFHAVLKEDFAFWLLSSIGLASNPLTHLTGLLLLLLSFWAIYERGYVDNDLAASRYEIEPQLTRTFYSDQVAMPALQPWVWALVSGAAGVAVLRPGAITFGAHFALWVAALIATYTCFVFYSRLDKTTRIWLYPFLQLARNAAFIVVVPIEPVGAAALGAHALSRWTPYQLYRLTSSRTWPSSRTELARLISFAILSLIIAGSVGLSALLTPGALALLFWNGHLARRAIHTLVKSAHRLDRESLNHGASD